MSAAGETVIIVVIIFPPRIRRRYHGTTTASTAIFTYSFQGSLLLLLFSCSKVSDYSSCTTKLGNPHPSIQTGHFDAVSKQRNEENEEPAEESNISKVKDGYRPRGPLAAFKLQRPRETVRLEGDEASKSESFGLLCG